MTDRRSFLGAIAAVLACPAKLFAVPWTTVCPTSGPTTTTTCHTTTTVTTPICECGGEPRPALEHNHGCPRKLTFYGGKLEWGMGKPGDVHMVDGVPWEWQTPGTWMPNYWASQTQ